ncbi:hypothetical protein NDN08_007222 [Rhodosorus marinus]|uniref:C2H2-type domain-containing protein n=1 Tax=Rhodosorus marinus TaxID=101924 RepID=A0AAV8UL72_9RHOD|nr:hypothetical protein NDN08_007222 [Rhodosorus marinus]
MDYVGSPASRICRYLVWNSVPMNWILFNLHKLSVPESVDWKTLLMDSRVVVPEATLQVLQENEMSKMLAALQQPFLLTTQFGNESYSLGSGWAFMGGLPEVDGEVNPGFTGLKRIRFLMYMEGSDVIELLSTEVVPGIVAFVKSTDVNERVTLSTWGILDKATETIIGTQPSGNLRVCEMCELLNIPCSPSTCKNEEVFKEKFVSRNQLKARWDFEKLTMEYGYQWMVGTWKVPMGDLEPITLKQQCHSRGALFDKALECVTQDEVLRVLPPRASFRAVKYEKDVASYFLDLENEYGMLGEESFADGGLELIGTSSLFDDALDPAAGYEGAHIVGISSQFSGEKGFPRDADELAERVRILDRRSSGSESKTASCDICGKQFMRDFEVKRHKVTVHQKRRDFACAECGRNFTQIGHLNEHVRVHHSGKNLHVCKVCGKKFGVKSKLRRHESAVHENRRTFPCRICNQSYKDKSYLRQHWMSQHPRERWQNT